MSDKKVIPYKTNDADYILPIKLHEFAKEFAKEVTGVERPVMEHALFIETFTICFQAMQVLGMVKDEYMVAEKPNNANENLI